MTQNKCWTKIAEKLRNYTPGAGHEFPRHHSPLQKEDIQAKTWICWTWIHVDSSLGWTQLKVNIAKSTTGPFVKWERRINSRRVWDWAENIKSWCKDAEISSGWFSDVWPQRENRICLGNIPTFWNTNTVSLKNCFLGKKCIEIKLNELDWYIFFQNQLIISDFICACVWGGCLLRFS